MGDLQRPERKVTILFVLTAVVFVFLGSILGTLWMLHLSSDFPFSPIYTSHPYFQMFGFLVCFIMGVAYSLFPRFAGVKLENKKLAYVNYFLIIVALFSTVYASNAFISEIYPASFLLAASLIFAYHIFSTVAKIKVTFTEANLLFRVSAISLCIFSALYLLGLVPQLAFYIFLLGFAGSMIFGVEVRSVVFRQSSYSKKLTKLAGITQFIALISSVLAVVFQPLTTLAELTFIFAAIQTFFSIRLIGTVKSSISYKSMSQVRLKIKRYNDVCLSLSFTWLFLGLIASMLNSYYNLFFLNDIAIHAIAMGFIGSAIVCFAPMFIPGIVTAKGPVTGLSYGPISILAAAVVTRIAGDLEAFFVNHPPSWEWLSGIFALLSIIWLLVLLLKIIGLREKSF